MVREGEGSLLFDAFALSRAVNELLLDGLADAPLTPTEYAVYSVIGERDPLTPSELSHALSFPRQTTTDWIALLRGREHIEVVANPADGRSQLISLTDAGRRAHRATNRHFERVYAGFLRDLPVPEAEARAMMETLIEAVRVARGERGRGQGAARTASSVASRPAK